MRLRHEGLVWRRTGDEVIALDLDSSQYFAANETAAAIWEALADGATRDDLVTMLCKHYEVEPQVAQADIDHLLKSLRSEGLIEPLGAGENP